MATSTTLPDSRAKWTQTIQLHQSRLNDFMPSGSQFSLPDFLRLRVLHRLGADYGRITSLATAHKDLFPKVQLDGAKRILDKSSEVQELKRILPNTKAFIQWKPELHIPSGRFAVGLELLYLIATRPEPNNDDEDDEDDAMVQKVYCPPRTRSQARNDTSDLASPFMRLGIKNRPEPQTPTRRGGISDLLVSPEEDSPEEESPESVISPPGTELRRIEAAYQRAIFSTGDEQTVNACLVTILMTLSYVLGITGRIHFDRTAFQMLRPDGQILYIARVDGILKTAGGDIQGYMEVKPSLRGVGYKVRMQEAAQMAAFVYEKSKSSDWESPTGPTKRWMISMDGYEAFITIATYYEPYIDFLKDGIPLGNTAGIKDFMVMEEYGPFDLRSHDGGLSLFLQYASVLLLRDKS
ncbi:MAG: hypothetical protein Q9163_005021 [Psora crenata]